MMKRLVPLLIAFVALLGSSGVIDAHHAVLRFNVEEMTVTADRVFVGRCVSATETRELIAKGLMPVTIYTFEVERALKGALPRRMTFRQLGHAPHRSLGKGSDVTMHGTTVTPDTFIHGMSHYDVGDRLVLFLIPNYLQGRVTYPVGLSQGAFRIATLPSGQQLVRNSINNLDLLTAPYNGTAMKASDARLIFPDRDVPLDAIAGSKPAAESLLRKRGGLPLDPFLELITAINAAHGGVKGEILR